MRIICKWNKANLFKMIKFSLLLQLAGWHQVIISKTLHMIQILHIVFAYDNGSLFKGWEEKVNFIIPLCSYFCRTYFVVHEYLKSIWMINFLYFNISWFVLKNQAKICNIIIHARATKILFSYQFVLWCLLAPYISSYV